MRCVQFTKQQGDPYTLTFDEVWNTQGIYQANDGTALAVFTYDATIARLFLHGGGMALPGEESDWKECTFRRLPDAALKITVTL